MYIQLLVATFYVKYRRPKPFYMKYQQKRKFLALSFRVWQTFLANDVCDYLKYTRVKLLKNSFIFQSLYLKMLSLQKIRKELEENLDNVIINNPWGGLEKSVSTYKTPTYLLLNEKREFEAFGYEAEKRYAELHQQGRHQRCFFFRRFRTKLGNSQV